MRFTARIQKIGVNPYVRVPRRVLADLLRASGKSKGPVPVRGRLNGHDFTQTVVKYAGLWRLYLNTAMRKAADIDVGDEAVVDIRFDPRPRAVAMHSGLAAALAKDPSAQAAFEALTPSHRQEVLRYLHSLKNRDTVERNVDRVIGHLVGKRPRTLGALMRR